MRASYMSESSRGLAEHTGVLLTTFRDVPPVTREAWQGPCCPALGVQRRGVVPSVPSPCCLPHIRGLGEDAVERGVEVQASSLVAHHDGLIHVKVQHEVCFASHCCRHMYVQREVPGALKKLYVGALQQLSAFQQQKIDKGAKRRSFMWQNC
jgi:hypothetical protein